MCNRIKGLLVICNIIGKNACSMVDENTFIMTYLDEARIA